MNKALIAAILLIVPTLILAYSSGPPDAKTGAPGEGTCHDCHNSFPLNSGDGSLTITAPTEYSAGETYQITIQVADNGQSRWGFEFTPLNHGSITITDPTNTQMSTFGNNVYVKHTTTGTHNGTPDGPVSWTFDWTAPVDPPSMITLYCAGNAANGNLNNQGDYIYTTSFNMNLAVGIDEKSDPLPNALALNSYPNPFNAVANISYNLSEPGPAILGIYDVNGRYVRELVNGGQAAGNHIVSWNGTDNHGRQVTSGVYFIRLLAGSETLTDRLVLLK